MFTGVLNVPPCKRGITPLLVKGGLESGGRAARLKGVDGDRRRPARRRADRQDRRTQHVDPTASPPLVDRGIAVAVPPQRRFFDGTRQGEVWRSSHRARQDGPLERPHRRAPVRPAPAADPVQAARGSNPVVPPPCIPSATATNTFAPDRSVSTSSTNSPTGTTRPG